MLRTGAAHDKGRVTGKTGNIMVKCMAPNAANLSVSPHVLSGSPRKLLDHENDISVSPCMLPFHCKSKSVCHYMDDQRRCRRRIDIQPGHPYGNSGRHGYLVMVQRLAHHHQHYYTFRSSAMGSRYQFRVHVIYLCAGRYGGLCIQMHTARKYGHGGLVHRYCLHGTCFQYHIRLPYFVCRHG